MPIKPIDFQVAIPRTMEASKISSNDANKNLAMQQQAFDSVHHKAENTLKQVYSRSKSEEARILERQKENRKNRENEMNGQENSDSEEKEKATKKKNHNLDGQASVIDIKI